QEAGTIGSDNFVEAVSGWQIDGDGNAEFNSVALRGGLLEDSDIRNLTIKGAIKNDSEDFLINSQGITLKTDTGTFGLSTVISWVDNQSNTSAGIFADSDVLGGDSVLALSSDSFVSIVDADADATVMTIPSNGSLGGGT